MHATLTAPAAAVEGAGPPLLQVAGLAVRFGSQEVLRDISVELSPGETLVVLGESPRRATFSSRAGRSRG